MTKEDLYKLIDKYEKGLCTEQEKARVESFLQSFQDTESIPHAIDDQNPEKADKIFDKILDEIGPQTKPVNQTRRYFITTVLIVLGLLGLYWVYQGVQAFLDADVEKENIIYAEVQTAEKERKTVQLPDGSRIQLNENTSLRYPKNLEEQANRTVYLEGEAYFDVASDSTRPFIAVSNSIRTTVLGTSFNIRARKTSSDITIALVEGSVRVDREESSNPRLLQPGETFFYSGKNNRDTISPTKGNLDYAWKEAIILFEKASVQEVIQALSDRYMVTIQIQNPEKIKSELVYRLDTAKYSLREAAQHINQVTDYKFIFNEKGGITVRPK